MNNVTCKKCGGTWDEPIQFDDAIFEKVAKMIRSNNPMEVFHCLTKESGVSPKGAKGILIHTTRVKGICHICNSKLEKNKKTECSNCGSINYDW